VFNKVLIANRGEIAVRVIRACKELGIGTVAVYSELDANALHVRIADEAYALGGQAANESYLNTEAILNAIKESGAEAVHPGYGFFSENADFARAISEIGVKFIGPPPEAIEVMGDKISAREAAEKVDVHGVPGATEFLTDVSQVVEFGNSYGWPVAIKAAFGGGGRGMKVVTEESEAVEALESAQREALSYFGRSECYLEKYLTNPRHVEVQLICDEHGNGVYLSQRDCSAQRRHQKLIEEAPVPEMSEDLAKAMGEAALAVAKGCDYTNAGTVEFLLEDGEFHYLEMNTRLQVEHPVTELVTGTDLVALQIKVAAGEKLPFTQDEVAVNGHAIEIRINAEEPAKGAFSPSPGKITHLIAPSGFGVRWDGGYEAGDEISQYYDNLVGKLICWGETRQIAIDRTIRALEEFEIEGVATTIPADLAILKHPDFQNAVHSTKWVENTLDLSELEPTISTRDFEGETQVKKTLQVELDGKAFEATVWIPESSLGSSKAKKKKATSSSAGSGSITVPMQGTVIKVLVEEGQAVEVGETLMVLEAMKMENNIEADVAGTVKDLKVEAGQSVSGGDIAMTIE